MLYNWIHDVTIGNPKTNLQYTLAGENKEKKKARVKDEAIPKTMNI